MVLGEPPGEEDIHGRLYPTDNALPEEKIDAVVYRILEREADGLIAKRIAAFVAENARRARELSLMVHIVRVEEEPKSLREMEALRFEGMEKRFESLQREMDKCFSLLQWTMGLGFSSMVAFMTALKFWF